MVVDRSTVMLSLLAAFVLAMLAGLGVVLVRERRAYARVGKARAWTFVRIAALPLLLATVAVVLVPTRAIGGPEALAALYGLLFTAAPLIWFGGHWIAGRAARPPLSASESFLLAATLPAFLIAASFLAGALQPLAWSITLAAERAGYGMADEAPARHQIAASRRWSTPSGDVTLARWTAPEDVRVERIDLLSDGPVLEDAGRTQLHRICQAPGAIVLVRPASAPATTLRVYWRDGSSRLHVSTLPAPEAAGATPFEVEWRGDTAFVLPEPLPRQAVSLGWERDPPGTFWGSDAQQYQPGETFDRNSCLPKEWKARFPLRGLRVRIENAAAQEPLLLDAVRTPQRSDAAS